MIAALALASVPTFVESRIDVGTEHFEYQLAEVDADLLVDLLVTSSADGERTLRLWRQRADATFPAAPDFRMVVPPDVVSYALLDLRPEPGRELLLLTRGGVFSLTTSQPGLQGNLRRELALPLFPDLADPDRLPCWRLVKDVDGDGREELLVVSQGDLVALTVERGSDGAGKLVPKLRCPCRKDAGEEAKTQIALVGGSFSVNARRGNGSLFPGGRSSRPTFEKTPLLSRREAYHVPALFDWDGDGRLDVVELGEHATTVRRQGGDGVFAAESDAIPNPIAIAGEGTAQASARRNQDAPKLDLRDVDGDGRCELVVTKSDGSGTNPERVLLVFRRDAQGRPADAPSARVKLAGMDVDYEFVDVDRDGRLDLIAKVTTVPTGLTSLATIRLDTAFHVFRGHAEGTLSREPDLSLERSFRPEQLTRVEETLLTKIDGDFDGDGLNDLALTQLDGRVVIRAIRRDGEKFELDDQSIASFQPPSPVKRLETWDLSHDDIADLMLRHERGFTLFVSKRGGGP